MARDIARLQGVRDEDPPQSFSAAAETGGCPSAQADATVGAPASDFGFLRRLFLKSTGDTAMEDIKKVEFEVSRSFAYNFARYVILPELQQLPEVQCKPFLLREVAKPLIDKHLTMEQQATRVKKEQSDVYEPMGQIVRFYMYVVVKELGDFVWLGKGMFRIKTREEREAIPEEELEAIEDEDEGIEDLAGHIYAFSFPSIIKDGDAVFPIKIGKTTGDVNARVADQCKSAAVFEQPKILRTWDAKRVGPTELALHNILKARGKHRENGPGREWFDTTIAELEAIIKFVVGPS